MKTSLIIEYARRDLSERFAGSEIGGLWNVVWPLVNIAIYTIIFSKIIGARLPGDSSAYSYSIYLVAGLLPWNTFSSTITRITTVFVQKRAILTKIRVSLPYLPIYIVLSEAFIYFVSMMIFIVYVILTGYEISEYIFFVPLIFAVQQIFAFSVGFFCAIFYVFMRDIGEVVSIVMQIWFWFTPIVYVVTILPETLQPLFRYNPACAFINSYQQIFLFNQPPFLRNLIFLAIIAHIILIAAYLIYLKLEKDIRDFV